MNPAEREGLIRRYAGGPRRLRQALAKVPAAARKWRPAAVRFCLPSRPVQELTVRDARPPETTDRLNLVPGQLWHEVDRHILVK